ncbi:hypothetical protein BH09MYX1_BH09MYX1_15590 [soil metagenome]
MRALAFVVGAVAVVSLGAWACGGSQPSGFGNDGGTPGNDAGVDDTGNPFDLDTGLTEGGGKKHGCSGDLRNVIDENGVVIQTCPPDQGCGGGICVPACQAAAASKGSIGCDYVVPTPSFYSGIKPPCFAVFVANNWPSDVKLNVSRNGTTYNVSQFGRIAGPGAPTSWAAIPPTGVPAGKVAVLFMSHDPASQNSTPLTCPITPAISANEGSALPGSGSTASVTGRGKAWHIVADAPITAYDILPYGGAKSYLPSAELLFPTTAWGTNYFGIVPFRGSAAPQWGQLVASEDGTQVKVLPSVALPAGPNVAAAPANVQATYTLNAGEYIQWQESNEMSGTVFQSTKPISFFGGQGYDCYTSTTSPSGGGCDSAHQQVPQVSAFASEYAIAPYTTRRADLQEEAIRYRFVGAVAGTTLTYSPAVAGAPATIGVGQVVDFQATGPFVVKSQDINHPFYVAQIMPGCNVTSGSRPPGGCLGDEEYVNMLPPAQFLTKYVFFTDPTYPTTNLVFTRVKTSGAFQDVKLDCAGTLTGWKPLGGSGTYEYTNVDLIRGGTKNGTCDNGPHSAESTGAFTIMVWGLDSAASYAYPAGGNVAPINTVIVPPTPN